MRGFNNTMLLIYKEITGRRFHYSLSYLHGDKILNMKGLIFSTNITKVALKAEGGIQAKLDKFLTI